MTDEHRLGRLPLIALLGHAHDALEHTFDQRIRESEFSDLTLAMSRNVLRHLNDADCRASQLTQRCGVSKQALSLQIAHLERTGYVTTSSDPTDGRARLVRLTARGERAQALVRTIMNEMDEQWRRHWGEETWNGVRGHLAEVLASRDQPENSPEGNLGNSTAGRP